MVDDRQPERAGIGERRAQDRGRPDRRPVVRETDDARVGELAECRELLPSPPDRDRAVGQQLDRRAGGERGGANLGEDARLVEGRCRVGHRADRGEAAVRGRRQSGRHRLGVLVARLAQVRVEVDEARRDHDPAGVDPLRVGATEPGDGLEDPVAHDDLARALAPGCRIDQPGPADLEIGSATGHAAPAPVAAACVPASR